MSDRHEIEALRRAICPPASSVRTELAWSPRRGSSPSVACARADCRGFSARQCSWPPRRQANL